VDALDIFFGLTAAARTTQEVQGWIKEYIVPGATQSDLDRLLELYPANVTKGSPFNTGTNNTLTSQYKRLAAFQGDAIFQAPRRFFLQQRSGKQTTYSFCEHLHTCVYTLGYLDRWSSSKQASEDSSGPWIRSSKRLSTCAVLIMFTGSYVRHR